MSKKVISKKIIVTTNFGRLTENALSKAFNKLQNGVANNAPAGLTVSPTTAAVKTQIDARNDLFIVRSGLEAQLKQNTEDIHSADVALKGIFTDQWAAQVQNFPGITVNQIKGMAFGIKGLDNSHADTRVDVYGQTGGTEPDNLAALVANGGGWLGTAVKGKYLNRLTVNTNTKNQPEFYIAVYIDKLTKKPAAQSNVESENIE